MGTKMADVIARVTSQTAYSSLLVGDKFGFYSARQYGAVGDGVIDDSAAILEMMDAADATTSKALYFPTGVYVVDAVSLTSAMLDNYLLFGDNASFSGVATNIPPIAGEVVNLVNAKGDTVYATANNAMSVLTMSASSKGDIMQSQNGIPSWQPKSNVAIYDVAGAYAFTPPISGMYEVTLTGGGGSGATGWTTDASGGAGAAGGTVISQILLSSSESINIIVGAGGVCPSGTTNTIGVNGGASLFDGYMQANEGLGGCLTTAPTPSVGGYGSVGFANSSQSVIMYGGNGQAGIVGVAPATTNKSWIRTPGASYFGGNGAYGSGGINGYYGLANSTIYRTNGTDGICIIKY